MHDLRRLQDMSRQRFRALLDKAAEHEGPRNQKMIAGMVPKEIFTLLGGNTCSRLWRRADV